MPTATPTLQSALRQLFLADASIAQLVGDRVRPMYGAQTDARPYLTIQISSNQATITHSGNAGSRNAVAEVAIVSDTYRDADQLAHHIDRVLNGYRGVVNGVRIAPAQFDDESDIEQGVPEGQSLPAYVKTVTYRCRYVLQPS